MTSVGIRSHAALRPSAAQQFADRADNSRTLARIQGWYHPLPWVGEKIHDVSCPRREADHQLS